MSEEKLLELTKNSMLRINKEDAPLIVKILKELEGITINDAIAILNITESILPMITKINLN